MHLFHNASLEEAEPKKNPRSSLKASKGENIWSGRRDLNPRLQPWQGCTLPLSYSRIYETARRENTLEAASRFELEMEVLQTSALPLGYAADKKIGAGDGI